MSKSNGMVGNQNGRKYHVHRETIERLYLDEKRSITEIEKILGYPGVYREIRRLGIPRRDCRKKADLMSTIQDICYAAGFFDGEGSVLIQKPGRTCSYRLRVSASQTTVEPIEWLRQRWGGSVRIRKAKENRKTVWEWAITTQLALKFLTDVRPFLLVKREQADIAIEFQSRKFNGSRRLPEVIAMEEDSRHKLLSLRSRDQHRV